MSDLAHKRLLLRACCRALMAADHPSQLTQEEAQALTQFCDEQARELGFESWVDAYHNLN